MHGGYTWAGQWWTHTFSSNCFFFKSLLHTIRTSASRTRYRKKHLFQVVWRRQWINEACPAHTVLSNLWQECTELWLCGVTTEYSVMAQSSNPIVPAPCDIWTRPLKLNCDIRNTVFIITRIYKHYKQWFTTLYGHTLSDTHTQSIYKKCVWER